MASNAPRLDCVDDYERLAKEKASKDKKLKAAWYFIKIGTGYSQTLDDSRAAFSRFRFQPRILSAKRERSTWTTLLGNPVSMPIGISPVLGYSWFHPDGDAAGGRAAARAGTVQIVTSASDLAIEDFAAKVPDNGLYWAQTYLFRDKRNTLRLVRNAERLGFKAIVVTVDSPVEHKGSGLNRGEMEVVKFHQISTAANIKYIGGVERDPKPVPMRELWTNGENCYYETFCCADWDDLAWLQSQTKLPIVLKGVLTAESARQAAKTGISGILVSAHGGRQLDGVPAPLDTLPEIVDAVKDTNVEVYMDGGVRTGNDVVKALALGARAVFIGRPALFGLAVNGEDGIFQILKILEKELSICMALCGCSSLPEITRSIVKHESEFHHSKL
ncbi:Hydroxyacid oxidase 2 [Holothuria leucospilota]|uniref:(S)-2-hydroxy-acid oxidase n=1 Tax=Holothuria leucospilota TaxID=206669 RepID=A0A9Q1BIZ8_HOLLE|nr:Hydroxyacid oxidase 2 [Holothuria leucospilota]